MADSRRHRVAVVDDEAQLRELYTAVLADEYEVCEADSGEAALDEIDEDVDAMLLDRELVRLSGVEVLYRLREAGSEIPVAMVTAELPDLDVLELSVDDYVVKPVGADGLQEVVETLLLRREYDEVVREYYALASRLAALRSSRRPAALEADDRFAQAEDRLAALKRRATSSLDTAIKAGTFEAVVREPASTD